jgi:DNA-binding NarL/FixJ family response regulator
MARTVVLVGHCGVDGPRLQSELSRLPGVEVTRVNSAEALESAADDADLLLINREPVGFDEDGLDVLREVRRAHPETKVMLVSDHADAQAEAERAGALPGFGKSLMGTGELGERVKEALNE